jgi:hypothetical protein
MQRLRPLFLTVTLLALLPPQAHAAASGPVLLPKPQQMAVTPACTAAIPRALPREFHGAAFDLISERWRSLGIAVPNVSIASSVRVHRVAMPPQAYRLIVTPQAIDVRAGDDDGIFYAAMTLAQLPQAQGARTLPCVTIADAPALRWRILSDDVSRGPLPTMRYFKERIRTIAAFKMNGYSPYMEHVFVDPHHPLPAPLDGITPGQLGELARYARRYHVAFIPEQQTFAHMHNTLKYERYAGDAELPHGFLLSPAQPDSEAYETQLIRDELAVVPHPPFFHIGSDETSSLGNGRSQTLVNEFGRTKVYADHINAMARAIAPSSARPMLWDDGIQADPKILGLIPKNAVIINWHYGDEKTFAPYIRTIANGGFDQMAAPGAHNWNNIFPDWPIAWANESRFIDEAKQSHVMGVFQTVWHDDGESLFEATWVPVIYAAANGWQQSTSDRTTFEHDFVRAFFGSSDDEFARDIDRVASAQTLLTHGAYEGSNYFFWADPFDSRVRARISSDDIHAARLEAEAAEQHLLLHAPPMHRNAANVLFLAARRYDALGRRYQIADEVRGYYDEARATQGKPGNHALRDLYWCKYWFWEQRDNDTELGELYARAWRFENRESHLGSNLAKFARDAQISVDRAERVNRVTVEVYGRKQPLPPLDAVLGLPND